MTTPGAGAFSQGVRDQVARALMLLAALGALSAFAGSVGTATAAPSEFTVVEIWRVYGFVVFAGLFVLLAFRPAAMPTCGRWWYSTKQPCR